MAIITVTFATFVSDAGIGTVAWSNPGNAAAADGLYAGPVALGGGAISHYLKCTNRSGAAIPTGATINGFALRYLCSFGSVIARDKAIRIVKSGVIGATDKSDTVNNWNLTTDTTQTRGGTADLWGESWTAADVNAANFGFAIACWRPTGTTPNASGRINYVEADVYYTPVVSGSAGNYFMVG